MLSCEQFEILLADEIDGALSSAARAGERALFLEHMRSCASCAALAEDAMRAVEFMERAAEPEMPPVLVARILEATHSGWELKLRGKGLRGWINRTFAPVLQPRIVMSAMLTLMSITMLSRCAGGPKRTLTAADLDPVRLWTSLDDRTHRVWDRAMKGYESMRLIYEIKGQLREWKQQQSEADEAAADARANSRKLDSNAVGRNKEKGVGHNQENESQEKLP
jgi:hypothetical protein